MISVNINGFSQFSRKLNKYLKDIENNTNNELNKGAGLIASSARSKSQFPSITAQIHVNNNEGTYSIETINAISAYVEFGTGDFAKVQVGKIPTDWQEMARSFFVNGLGRVPAFPYLYPAYFENRLKVVENIKKILSK